jgi:hypothetical protein
MKMMMKATAMCGTEMMRRLLTTILVVMRSRILSGNKITKFLKNPRRCLYEMEWNAIIHSN